MDQSAILVYGSGRSGTTWVQDVLADANGYDTVFEPLHPDAVKGASAFANLYLEPNENNDSLRNFLQLAISGNLRSVWASLRARPDRLFPPLGTLLTRKGAGNTKATYIRTWTRWQHYKGVRNQAKIVKFIRANLLIGWIQQEFGCKAAYVVRHPCAVLSSVGQRWGSEWQISAMRELLHRYLDQESLAVGRLAGKIEHLSSLETMAEIHAAIWCIENAHLVGRDLPAGVSLACYEDLVINKEVAWSALTQDLGLAKAPEATLLSRPSQQARYTMNEKTSDTEKLSTWQARLETSEKRDVQQMLEFFEVEFYNVDSAMPVDFSQDQRSAQDSIV
jgi:hypothetical protein